MAVGPPPMDLALMAAYMQMLQSQQPPVQLSHSQSSLSLLARHADSSGAAINSSSAGGASVRQGPLSYAQQHHLPMHHQQGNLDTVKPASSPFLFLPTATAMQSQSLSQGAFKVERICDSNPVSKKARGDGSVVAAVAVAAAVAVPPSSAAQLSAVPLPSSGVTQPIGSKRKHPPP